MLTGASGHLGSAFCARYADRYDIVAVYHNHLPAVPSQHLEFVDPLTPNRSIAESCARVFAVQADLTSEHDCERVVELALARFDRIDVLVNNAATWTMAPMLGSNRLVQSAAAQFATNVIAPLQLAATVSRLTWQADDRENRARNRNIVNVSSVSGLRVYPDLGQSVYAATKAALNHLTAHMALEFRAIGVRVNATAPNSVPAVVSADRASDAIVRLDEGAANGTLVVVDSATDTEIALIAT